MATNEASVLQHDHVHPQGEVCPWCEHPITHDKFEEIQARIQREERERAAALEQRLKGEHQAALTAKDAEREQAVTAALAEEKRAATQRETKIRAEAEQAARTALTEKLTAADTRAKTAEERLTAAEQTAKDLAATLEADKKAASEREAAIRLEATQKAEAAQNKIVAEATTRATAAEQQLKNLAASHEVQLNQRIQEELTKAKEAYEKQEAENINEVRATEFAKTQKLQTKIDSLQRELNKKTSNEIGEGEEVKLFDALRDAFPKDCIKRIPKGEPGADIHHEVHQDGQHCGVILYDSKARKSWQYEFATKLREDQMSAKAEHAVLSSFKFPKGKSQVCEVNSVIVANPARVVDIVQILRQDVVRSHRLRLSGEDRAKKSTKLYELITSERFVQKLARVDELADELLQLDEKEMQAHKKMWESRGTKERAIQKANADLRIDIDSILEG